MIKGKKVKMGKKNCECDFKFNFSGDKLNLKLSTAKCDKKCTGQVKGFEMKGKSGNVYTIWMKSSKGKATITKGLMELGMVPTGSEEGSGSGSSMPIENGPACSCVDKSKMESSSGSGSMPGSGSTSGSGSMPGSGSEPGSGSGT